MTYYVYWIRGTAYADIAEMSIASVRKIDPEPSIHVWCDDPTTRKIEGVAWHDFAPGRPAMVANLDAQIAALNYLIDDPREADPKILFLDVDTLLRKPFPWAPAADLYVTWRWEVAGDRDNAIIQPYNYGVLGCENNSSVREAFIWLRSRVLGMNPQNRDWYGNQLALAELVGCSPQEGEAKKLVRIRWAIDDPGATALIVRQLPCSTWNYTPEEIGEDVTDKGILHLKGDRKDMMEHYA